MPYSDLAMYPKGLRRTPGEVATPPAGTPDRVPVVSRHGTTAGRRTLDGSLEDLPRRGQEYTSTANLKRKKKTTN